MTALAGKAILVTGASQGIGAETARACAAAGASVVLAARDADALEAVAVDIRADGGEATCVPTDVTDEAAVERLIAAAVGRYGRLDGACNNAGEGHRPTPLAELSTETFDRTIALDLRGLFFCLRAELRVLAAGGSIVNMSSSAGLRGAPGMGAYSAAKHGVVGLTATAALDHGPQAIRVNAVAPGPILTERGIGRAPRERQEQVAASLPAGRLGEPRDVAELVVWLLSDAAAFVNGTTISVDGGKLAGGA